MEGKHGPLGLPHTSGALGCAAFHSRHDSRGHMVFERLDALWLGNFPPYLGDRSRRAVRTRLRETTHMASFWLRGVRGSLLSLDVSGHANLKRHGSTGGANGRSLALWTPRPRNHQYGQRLASLV